MSEPRLPFTVIGGFLGAGKTTLLNHWLRHAAGRRLAVLVNDFGALNIDAELIAATAGDTVALTNGCVCCQIGDDLSLALMRVLDSGTPFDAVVVEASGVSDPWRIAQLGRADPRLQLDGVIVLVDAGAALAQSRDPLLADTLERQLTAADLILVNKVDLCDGGPRSVLGCWIESVAGSVTQFDTEHALVPLPLLSGLALNDAHLRRTEEGASCAPHEHEPNHLHDDPSHGALFDTWSCRPVGTFEAEALRTWLKAPPPGLLRLKGLLRTNSTGAGTGWCELQFSGKHGTLRHSAEPHSGAALVAIALRGQLPSAQLSAYFEPAGVHS